MPEVPNPILLVDDEPDVLMILSFHLQRAGYTVVLAENGAEALEKAAQEKPILVILDLMMPEMDGAELCRRLRQTQPGLYIIMLTALGSEQDRIKGLEAGADDYIVKPFNPKELVLRVRAILRRGPGEADVGGRGTATTPLQVQPTQAREGYTRPLPSAAPAPSRSTNQPPDLAHFAAKSSSATPSNQTNGNGASGPERLQPRNLDAYLEAAGKAAQVGDFTQARELYQYVVKLDPSNDSALMWLAWHTNDPYEGVKYLERLVAKHPENQRLQEFLDTGKKRCQDLDRLISGSNVLSYWNIAEQVQSDRMQKGVDRRVNPITPLGQLLLKKGYINRSQLETAVSLHEMFNRLGTPKKLGEVLLEYGYLTKEQLQVVLSEQQSDFNSQFY